MKREEIRRMSDRQKKQVVQLIRRECCNCYEGNCLLLDDGELEPCPQMLTNSLLCRWFRREVLPIDKALEAEIMGQDGVKTCEACGRPFRAVSNRAKYCGECSRQIKRIQAVKRMARHRAAKTG